MDSRLAEILRANGISAEQTEAVLIASDYGRKNSTVVDIGGFPDVNGKSIVDVRSMDLLHRFEMPFAALAGLGTSDAHAERLLNIAVTASKIPGARFNRDELLADKSGLSAMGLFLVPLVSFGVLNGGSASSYFDTKKNQEFAPGLYALFKKIIDEQSKNDEPKGLTPAYFNPDGSPGRSFMALKVAIWCKTIAAYKDAVKSTGLVLPWHGLETVSPFFQMTSTATSRPLAEAIGNLDQDPLVAHFLRQSSVSLAAIETEVQSLIAAFSLPGVDGKRGVFFNAYGDEMRPLGLPGGHGQNFAVLKPVYEKMLGSGKRFAYLGNTDNTGYFPDHAAVAITALSRVDASFEFSFRTPMDHKGGVLVSRSDGRFSTADIGQSVQREIVDQAEADGKRILFNCATGLFDLKSLVPSIDRISRELPVRFSNQDKDAGRYSQAEQSTWEVLPLFEHSLILGVEKSERFLAAKLFLDCLLTSGMGLQHIDDPSLSDKERSILAAANSLSSGLQKILRERCGLEIFEGKWR